MPDGRLLLRDLMEHATQREFVYRHAWRAGDLVMWDNRCTLHRGRAYDDASHSRDLGGSRRRIITGRRSCLRLADRTSRRERDENPVRRDVFNPRRFAPDFVQIRRSAVVRDCEYRKVRRQPRVDRSKIGRIAGRHDSDVRFRD